MRNSEADYFAYLGLTLTSFWLDTFEVRDRVRLDLSVDEPLQFCCPTPENRGATSASRRRQIQFIRIRNPERRRMLERPCDITLQQPWGDRYTVRCATITPVSPGPDVHAKSMLVFVELKRGRRFVSYVGESQIGSFSILGNIQQIQDPKRPPLRLGHEYCPRSRRNRFGSR